MVHERKLFNLRAQDFDRLGRVLASRGSFIILTIPLPPPFHPSTSQHSGGLKQLAGTARRSAAATPVCRRRRRPVSERARPAVARTTMCVPEAMTSTRVKLEVFLQQAILVIVCIRCRRLGGCSKYDNPTDYDNPSQQLRSKQLRLQRPLWPRRRRLVGWLVRMGSIRCGHKTRL